MTDPQPHLPCPLHSALLVPTPHLSGHPPKAIQSLAEYSHIPVQMLSSPRIKGMMCNMLKYHVVDGVHLKKTWTAGQKFTTMYNNAELTVSGVGQQAAVTTTTGVQANVKRVVFCGNSVVFGIDAVLTPFKVPRLGLGHH